MKCREMVELMTDYLEGALSARDRERFDQHIAGCDGCRAYLEQMRATRSAVSKLAYESIPERIQEQLLEAFRNWRASSS